MNKIFAAAGLPTQDLRVGDKTAMRKNCDRYIDALSAGGPWVSYAELEAERDLLAAKVAVLKADNARFAQENIELEERISLCSGSCRA